MILNIFNFFSIANPIYVIVSHSEHKNDKHGYWSNEEGWTKLENAALFNAKQKEKVNLPAGAEGDVEWWQILPTVKRVGPNGELHPVPPSMRPNRRHMVASQAYSRRFDDLIVLAKLDGHPRRFYSFEKEQWGELADATVMTRQEREDFEDLAPDLKPSGGYWFALREFLG